ncbi:Mitochondrial ubiquitin ligase activator of nfkb 1-A [Amphibalanus amphitrite]|uniref:RING-type E3 ubiquitin transferase n=1 Tax=Amphibalanus amphitrite TaxID=1232801 RepID=A0A6A4VSS6_AMPAM|nr:Mitochondrial ubiquitin ligase activator of nfkb 1-A [Amphibalanus amphitrite]
MPVWGLSGSDVFSELRGVAVELCLLAGDALLCTGLAAAARNVGAAVTRVRDAPGFEAGPSLVERVTAAGGRMDFVAVRGEVRALGEPIRAHADPSVRGVMQRLSLREHTWENHSGFWSERRRTVREALNTVPFALSGAGLAVVVQDADSLSADLFTVKDEFVPTELSLAQSVWQWLLGSRQQGLRDVEEMLLEGTRVTGYGELTLMERGLELRPPSGELPFILTTRSETALLRELEAQRNVARGLLAVFVLSGLCGAAWTGRRLWRGLEERRRRRRLADEYEAIRTERRRRERVGDTVEEALQCVVCLTNPREVVVSPCQHVCLCVDCEEQLQQRSCPVCRRKVTGVLPVYLA